MYKKIPDWTRIAREKKTAKFDVKEKNEIRELNCLCVFKEKEEIRER